jgi:hypothetical protein
MYGVKELYVKGNSRESLIRPVQVARAFYRDIALAAVYIRDIL